MAEKIGTMLLQMAVSLIILRLLTRDILGVMAIPTAVVAVALVLVDSGFSQALIRKAAPSADDYKSVFAFNIGVSLVMYALFTALAFPASRFYDMPLEIAQIAPVFFLQLPIGALCAIQNTICVRQFRFALLSKVTFASSLAGGLAAIGLALAGFGIWCIVARRVLEGGGADSAAVVAERLAALRGVQPRAAARNGSLQFQPGHRHGPDFDVLQRRFRSCPSDGCIRPIRSARSIRRSSSRISRRFRRCRPCRASLSLRWPRSGTQRLRSSPRATGRS